MTTAAAEQDEVETIPAIDVRGKNDNADDADKKNKDGGDSNGDGDGDGDGGAMLANGTEVSRCDVDTTRKRGDADLFNRTAAIGAHERQVFDKLLWGLVT